MCILCMYPVEGPEKLLSAETTTVMTNVEFKVLVEGACLRRGLRVPLEFDGLLSRRRSIDRDRLPFF